MSTLLLQRQCSNRVHRVFEHLRAQRSLMSSSADTEEVIVTKQNGAGTIILNRPKALNALNVNMVRRLNGAFSSWNEDNEVRLVIMKGAGDKSFCAGGDVVNVRAAVLEGKEPPKGQPGHIAADFFREEYIVNHMIWKATKPQISLLDGYVMGGGVGLSIGSTFRIATENTVLAMPETGIGLFPDVGATYWLPRLGGGQGAYIGLTGTRLKAPDLIYSGIATHYIPSNRCVEVHALGRQCLVLDAIDSFYVRQLAENHTTRYHNVRRLEEVEKALNDLSQGLRATAEKGEIDEVLRRFVEDPQELWSADLHKHKSAIDYAFGDEVGSVEEIVQRLESEAAVAPSPDESRMAWAAHALKFMKRASPTSLKVTLMALRRGRDMPLEETFPMEYRLSQGCMRPGGDFCEGIRALLVDKDKHPKWKPAKLEEVTQEIVEAHFERLPEDRELVIR